LQAHEYRYAVNSGQTVLQAVLVVQSVFDRIILAQQSMRAVAVRDQNSAFEGLTPNL